MSKEEGNKSTDSNKIIKPLINAVITNQPNEPIQFMMEWIGENCNAKDGKPISEINNQSEEKHAKMIQT